MFNVRVNLIVSGRGALEEAPIMTDLPGIFNHNIVVGVTASEGRSRGRGIKGVLCVFQEE